MTTGQLIADKYRLERVIGRGAMGTVWQAVHLGLEENVAVKLVARLVLAIARGPPALQGGSHGRGAAALPLRRAGLRHRRDRRRHPLHGDGAAGRRDAREAPAPRRRAAAGRRRPDHQPGGARPVARSRARHRAPRPEARQYLPRAFRRRRVGTDRQGARFRHRQDDRRATRARRPRAPARCSARRSS